jgi:pSer/pThr/pTyr-binding forkhead associated (FHA) protein
MSPVLVSLTDEKSFPLNRPSIFIGRDRWRVDVRLPGEQVEEVHCELIQHGIGFRLINLSDAGTLVNGQPVSEAVLQNGDELTIGTHRLRLSCGTATSEARIDLRSDGSAEEEWAALNQESETLEEVLESPPRRSAVPGVDSDQVEEESRLKIPRRYESLGTTDMIIEVTPESNSFAIALTARLKGNGISLER